MNYGKELRVFSDEENRLKLYLGDGQLSYEEIEPELLATIFECDPALDSATGRLLSGAKNQDIQTRLFLLPPDHKGISHLGGIECIADDLSRITEILEAKGYVVSAKAM